MLDKRGRDIGEPTVRVHVRRGTPEEVARNRARMKDTLERIYSAHYGPTTVEILWEKEMPQWYRDILIED